MHCVLYACCCRETTCVVEDVITVVVEVVAVVDRQVPGGYVNNTADTSNLVSCMYACYVLLNMPLVCQGYYFCSWCIFSLVCLTAKNWGDRPWDKKWYDYILGMIGPRSGIFSAYLALQNSGFPVNTFWFLWDGTHLTQGHGFDAESVGLVLWLSIFWRRQWTTAWCFACLSVMLVDMRTSVGPF